MGSTMCGKQINEFVCQAGTCRIGLLCTGSNVPSILQTAQNVHGKEAGQEWVKRKVWLPQI